MKLIEVFIYLYLLLAIIVVIRFYQWINKILEVEKEIKQVIEER